MHQNCWRLGLCPRPRWGSLHTIDEIHGDRLKIQRDERVIHEHTNTQNYCTRCFNFSPKCTKIVGGWGSAPDPTGGAYSAPPDPLAVTGWDGDGNNSCGGRLCAPLLVTGAPLLFWGWLRAWWGVQILRGHYFLNEFGDTQIFLSIWHSHMISYLMWEFYQIGIIFTKAQND